MHYFTQNTSKIFWGSLLNPPTGEEVYPSPAGDPIPQLHATASTSSGSWSRHLGGLSPPPTVIILATSLNSGGACVLPYVRTSRLSSLESQFRNCLHAVTPYYRHNCESVQYSSNKKTVYSVQNTPRATYRSATQVHWPQCYTALTQHVTVRNLINSSLIHLLRKFHENLSTNFSIIVFTIRLANGGQ